MALLTSMLQNIGEIYQPYWVIFDFAFFFAIFYYAMYNEKTKKLHMDKKMAMIISLALAFGIIITESATGKNMASIASYAIVLLAMIFGYHLWTWLRALASHISKTKDEKKLMTAIIAAILTLMLLSQLFGAETLSDAFSRWLMDIFDFTGQWIIIFGGILMIVGIVWALNQLLSKALPGEAAEGLTKEIKTGAGTAKEELDRLATEKDKLLGQLDEKKGELDAANQKLENALVETEELKRRMNEILTQLRTAQAAANAPPGTVSPEQITAIEDHINGPVADAVGEMEPATDMIGADLEESTGAISKVFDFISNVCGAIKTGLKKVISLFGTLAEKIKASRANAAKLKDAKIKASVERSVDKSESTLSEIDAELIGLESKANFENVLDKSQIALIKQVNKNIKVYNKKIKKLMKEFYKLLKYKIKASKNREDKKEKIQAAINKAQEIVVEIGAIEQEATKVYHIINYEQLPQIEEKLMGLNIDEIKERLITFDESLEQELGAIKNEEYEEYKITELIGEAKRLYSIFVQTVIETKKKAEGALIQLNQFGKEGAIIDTKDLSGTFSKEAATSARITDFEKHVEELQIKFRELKELSEKIEALKKTDGYIMLKNNDTTGDVFQKINIFAAFCSTHNVSQLIELFMTVLEQTSELKHCGELMKEAGKKGNANISTTMNNALNDTTKMISNALIELSKLLNKLQANLININMNRLKL